MPNAELDELIRAVVQRNEELAARTEASKSEPVAGNNVQVVVEVAQPELRLSPPVSASERAPVPCSTNRESESLAAQFEALRQALATQEAALKENTEGLASTASRTSPITSSVSSVTKNFISNIGSSLGVSPIIKGLAKLFGGSGSSEVAPATTPSTLPPALRIEAGLDARTQTLGPVSYGHGNEVRLPLTPKVAPATIQVNINAIDSQSFMDHSEDIARAVKEAMLHAHSLNDVVQEL